MLGMIYSAPISYNVNIDQYQFLKFTYARKNNHLI